MSNQEPTPPIGGGRTSTVRTGPSREIAAAFGTRTTAVEAHGSLRTRSHTGSLPPGSANFQRALRHQLQTQAKPTEHVPEQSEVPPPSGTNGDQPPVSENVPQHQLQGEDTIRRVCEMDRQSLLRRLDALTGRLNNLEPTANAGKTVGLDEFTQLRTELEDLKTQQQTESAPDQTQLARDVQLLRADVNNLLEARSPLHSVIRAEERPSVAQQPASQVGTQDSKSNQQPEQLEQKPFQQNGIVKHEPVDETSLLRQQIQSLEQEREALLSRVNTSREDKTRHSYRNRLTSRSRYLDISSSSEEGEQTPQVYGEDAHGAELHEETIPFAERLKGPRYPGLSPIKPSDLMFDRVMNYRYYRLKLVRNSRSANHTLELRKHLKSLEITFKNDQFTGEDPVLILSFLQRLVEEADTLGMTEGQAYIALPYVLKGTAQEQFRSSRSTGGAGGVTCWPEAIHDLLNKYATPSALREAVNHIQTMRQSTTEDEREFGGRVQDAAKRCGNVYHETEKMTFFVNGLLATTRSVVARYRESKPRDSLTFQQLMHFAKDEGDTYRERHSKKVVVVRTTKRSPPPRSVSVMETKTSTYNDGEDEEVLVMPEDSVPTSELPSTLPSEGQSEQLLLVGGTTPAAPIAYGGPSTTPNRVGWADSQPRPRQRLICHRCFEYDHTVLNCKLQVGEMTKVIKNYEALTASEKSRVPDTSYKAAKTFIEALEQARLKNDVNKTVGDTTHQSKN